jgi:hypothetical protein
MAEAIDPPSGFPAGGFDGRAPVVGAGAPELEKVRTNEEKLVAFVTNLSCMRHERVVEYCRDFAKRSLPFGTNRIDLMKFQINQVEGALDGAKRDRERMGTVVTDSIDSGFEDA